MKCTVCRSAPALKHKDICGVCEILAARTMQTELPGAVPSHFNYGLGCYVEGRDHLKKLLKGPKKNCSVGGWNS